ncbi:uncharacterized protein VP01_6421g1, partial [Puccinia sorghi]
FILLISSSDEPRPACVFHHKILGSMGIHCSNACLYRVLLGSSDDLEESYGGGSLRRTLPVAADKCKEYHSSDLKKERKRCFILAKDAVNLVATGLLDLFFPLILDLSPSLLTPSSYTEYAGRCPFDELLITLIYFINLTDTHKFWNLIHNALGAPLPDDQQLTKVEHVSPDDDEVSDSDEDEDANENNKHLIVETKPPAAGTIKTDLTPHAPNAIILQHKVLKSTTPSSRRLLATSSFAYMLRKKGISKPLINLILNDLNTIELDEVTKHGALLPRKHEVQNMGVLVFLRRESARVWGRPVK